MPISSLGVDGDVLIIPRNELQHSRNLSVGKTIVTFTKNENFLYVCNASKRPITLNECNVIGTLEPYENQNLSCNFDVMENQPIEILEINSEEPTRPMNGILIVAEKVLNKSIY